jgi:hypothetical protein
MQTFVPYLDHQYSAACLDRMRLGKQRVEGLQILQTLIGASSGWRNHPAVKMWAGHEAGLCAYICDMCAEWVYRGYKDNVTQTVLSYIYPDYNDLPYWWGDKRVHLSHRANLVRKMPEHYLEIWPDVNSTDPYYWPI